jgi:hypothetical protein
VPVARLTEHSKRRTQRQAQVGPCITVCDRKYVDMVQEILLADHPVDAGYERIGECRAIEMP